MVDLIEDESTPDTAPAFGNPVETVMAMLAGGVGSLDDLSEYLDRAVHAVHSVVDGCDAVGVTAVLEDRPRTAAYTTIRTLEIDAVQYAVGDGPCLDAFRNRRENLVDLETAYDLWPAFAQGAPDRDIRTLLALPLVSGDATYGALNLYAYERNAFDALDRAAVRLAATRIADAVATAEQISSARELAGQFEQAMATRATIEQAKGIIMGRHGVDETRAFELLSKQSQDSNTKLRDVASRLVRSVTVGS